MKTSATIKAAWIAVIGTVAATIIAGVFGLFKPSRPEPIISVGGNVYGDIAVMGPEGSLTIQTYSNNLQNQNDKNVQELLRLLKQRAAKILNVMADEKAKAISAINKGSGYVGAYQFLGKSASGEREFLENFEAIRRQFIRLHEKHIAAIMDSQFILAHEIVSEIHHLLWIQNRDIFWKTEAIPTAMYRLNFSRFYRNWDLYPGTKPTHLKGPISETVWPNISYDNEEEPLDPMTIERIENTIYPSYTTMNLVFIVGLSVLYPVTIYIFLLVSGRRAIMWPQLSRNWHQFVCHDGNLLSIALMLYFSFKLPLTLICLLPALIGTLCFFRSFKWARNSRLLTNGYIDDFTPNKANTADAKSRAAD